MPDRKAARRRPSPAPAQDADTEQRILDAAHSVFLRAGTAGARMQDIAAEAGVNHALVHYYFRSKDRLALAVFQRAAMKLLPPVVAILGGELPLEEKVRRVVQHELERAAQLVQTLAGLDPARVRPAVFATLAAQIEERVRAGSMRPIAVEQFVANLISLCIFPFAARPMLKTLLAWSDADFARFVARRRDELPDFFLAALRP